MLDHCNPEESAKANKEPIIRGRRDDSRTRFIGFDWAAEQEKGMARV